jgi:hypothetical protein
VTATNSSDYLFNDKRGGKKEGVEFDLLLTPNHTNQQRWSQGGGSSGGGGVGGMIAGVSTNGAMAKGYYDGLLDIPVIPSSSSTTRGGGGGMTPHRQETERPVRSSSSGKKPMYSWSLPGFGREDEGAGGPLTPAAIS